MGKFLGDSVTNEKMKFEHETTLVPFPTVCHHNKLRNQEQSRTTTSQAVFVAGNKISAELIQ